MKTIDATSPLRKDGRRVPKPQMEKRRRDRINNSLETLRLLLLENTRNEKLKNPKVEKAEILESVVNFLRKDPRVRGEQESPCKRQHIYQDGMKTCLLRVSRFISTKSQEPEETSDDSDGSSDASFQTMLGFPSPRSHPVSPGQQFHRTLTTPSTCDPAARSRLLPQHLPSPWQLSHPHTGPGLTRPTQRLQGTTRLLSSKPTVDVAEPVWRPWPQ